MMYLIGGNKVWPFKKKKVEPLELPFLDVPSEPAKDVVLYSSNEKESDLKENTSTPVEIEQKEEIQPEQVQQTMNSRITSIFIKTETHKLIVEDINDLSNNLDTLSKEIVQNTSTKDSRYEKINELQSCFDDVSKKLMVIDQSLFGG